MSEAMVQKMEELMTQPKVDVNDILFHPSALHEIMSGVKKGWDVENSKTCKTHLIEIARQVLHNRYNSFSSAQTEKGIKQEPDAINLYDWYLRNHLKTYDGKVLQKNTQRIENDYFTGEYDLAIRDDNGKIIKTVDIKCSERLNTLPHILIPPKDVEEGKYDYQGQGYMDLTGADEHTVAYCLVNSTGNLVRKAKLKAFYALQDTFGDNWPIEQQEAYKEECKRLEIEMIFDIRLFQKDNPGFEFDNTETWYWDIPRHKRVVEFSVKRKEDLILSIKSRITDCRQWMKKLF